MGTCTNWGSFIEKAKVVNGENHMVIGAMQGRGKSNFMLNDAFNVVLKESQIAQPQEIPEPNVEIVNHIPQEDLQHIVELYNEDSLNSLDKLGRGSYGTVYGYKGYAIKKIFDTDPFASDDAKVLKDISHLDSVITLYAIINDDMIVTERVEGQTIRSYTETSINNPLKLGNDTVEQFDKALLDIVKLGYTPWDMHGANVMVNQDGKIKIVDVGFFKKHGETYDDNEEFTYKSNQGYSQAQNLAISELKNYLRREQERKEQMAKVHAESLQFMAV